MKQVKAWQAADGKLFATPEGSLDYEHTVIVEQQVRKFIEVNFGPAISRDHLIDKMVMGRGQFIKALVVQS